MARLGAQRMRPGDARPVTGGALRAPAHGLLPARDAAGLPRRGMAQSDVRAVRAQAAPTRLPCGAGLEQALEYLGALRFTDAEIDWLARHPPVRPRLPRQPRGLRFTGDVDAVREGHRHLRREPMLRVVAPLPQAQIVETRLINLLQLQTLVARRRRAASSRRAASRWWTSACAAHTARRRRSWRARELPGRLCRHCHRARRPALRHSRCTEPWRTRSCRRMPDEREAFVAFARAFPARRRC